jgi:hypothetical protein
MLKKVGIYYLRKFSETVSDVILPSKAFSKQ